MSNVQLSNLEKATALLSVATVTIGVAGDKLAAEHVPGTGPILERVTEVLNDLGAISDWLAECLLGTKAQSEVPVTFSGVPADAPPETLDALDALYQAMRRQFAGDDVQASITPEPAGIEGVQANVDKAFHYLLNAMGIVETLDLDQIGEANVASLAMHIATMQRLQFLLKQQAEKVQP